MLRSGNATFIDAALINVTLTNSTTIHDAPPLNISLFILLAVCVTLSCVVFSALVVRFCNRG